MGGASTWGMTAPRRGTLLGQGVLRVCVRTTAMTAVLVQQLQLTVPHP